MFTEKMQHQSVQPAVAKCPTGIQGFDEITNGGLPQGRPTLIYGGPGCGKTIFGVEFLAHGATLYNEPGVLISFGETEAEIQENFTVFGLDLPALTKNKQLVIDHIDLEAADFVEIGQYNLDGLFVRLEQAINSIGAKRVVLDTIEALFANLLNQAMLRAEFQRLFRWLKQKNVTAIVTGERAADSFMTRHGLEEYLSDCVILLDHRVTDQRSTRRLRVIKYRGSAHGTDEYPFLIGEAGFYILPITSVNLEHQVSTGRVSTGIAGLDDMLGGGYYRGSTILVSGAAGTGKSSVAANFAHAFCRQGERCVYFTFEESTGQIIRNMRSIGLDLAPWVEQGLLQIYSVRPTAYGLEAHLVTMYRLITQFDPEAIIIDPITSLLNIGLRYEVKATLVRLIDFLKARQKTSLLTSLTDGDQELEQTDVDVSSLADTWLILNTLESSGERNRVMYIIKSRGMAHSNQVREFHLTDTGVKLIEPYIGPEGVLTGAARHSQEAREKAELLSLRHEIEQKQRALEYKRQLLEAKVASLQAEYEIEREELSKFIAQQKARLDTLVKDREEIAILRQASSNTDKLREESADGDHQQTGSS